MRLSVRFTRCTPPRVRACFYLSALLCANCGLAQNVPYERNYSKSKAEVEKVLRDLQAYSGGRLPTVEGFVASGDKPLDRYQRPYYQYSIEVLPGSSGGTRVLVRATITAWYADPAPSRSAYHALPSNGRLESDLLDRLEEALSGRPAAAAAGAAASPVIPRPSIKLDAPALTLRSPVTRSAAPPPSAGSLSADPPSGTAGSPKDADLATIRAQREAAENRQKELRSQVANLEEILRSQAHPDNLAVVRKSGTPVLAKPQVDGRVFFTAAAEDEFEIIELEGDWIHVQISGASRGWIRRGYLALPDSFRSATSASGPLDAAAKEPFRLVREEIVLFPGSWEPLHGKTVRIFTVQPATDAKESEPRVRLRFAKSLLLKFLDNLSPSPQELSGVVVVFDSADGGMIAATLSSLQRWRVGALSDSAFWQECHLDPPEAFRDDAAR